MSVSPYFYFPDSAAPVTNVDTRWRQPLPLGPLPVTAVNGARPVFTYGDYFSAVGAFFTQQSLEAVVDKAQKAGCLPAEFGNVDEVHIWAEKHGAFYHPARIRLADRSPASSQKSFDLVMNVAISGQGRTFIAAEYENLACLNETFNMACLPRVFAFFEARQKGHAVKMFLGQWCEGCEFHWHNSHNGIGRELAAWVPGAGKTRIGETVEAAIFNGIAKILTTYYNPLTSAQIYPWHQAAGDFIVNDKDGQIRLHLITVRRYAPALSQDNALLDPGAIVDQITNFLFLLTLRTRLDRIDGTGDWVWAPERVLLPTLNGFWQGLDGNVLRYGLPDPFTVLFRQMLAAQTRTQIETALRSLLHPPLFEKDVCRWMNGFIPDHAAALHKGLSVAA